MEAGSPWASHHRAEPHTHLLGAARPRATVWLRLKLAPSQALRPPEYFACVCRAPSSSDPVERDFQPFRKGAENLGLSRKGTLGLPDWATYSSCPEPYFGPLNELELCCKLPLAFGHLPAPRNLVERSGPGVGQNLDAPGVIIQKGPQTTTVYSHMTKSNRRVLS